MLLTFRVNIVCQTLQENMRSSELVTSDTTHHTTPHHTLTKEKRYLYLFSTVPCALSRSHEWERVRCMFDPSGVALASSVNKMLRIVWGLASIQRQISGRLLMSGGVRCQIPSIWYRHTPLRNVETLARCISRQKNFVH
jgi:hypothetical protein